MPGRTPPDCTGRTGFRPARIALQSLIALGTLAIAACSTVSPDAVIVRITSNPEAVRGCEHLGEIRGTARPIEQTGADDEPALDDLRRRTASIGADTVLIVCREPAIDAPVLRGRAYDCGSGR